MLSAAAPWSVFSSHGNAEGRAEYAEVWIDHYFEPMKIDFGTAPRTDPSRSVRRADGLRS